MVSCCIRSKRMHLKTRTYGNLASNVRHSVYGVPICYAYFILIQLYSLKISCLVQLIQGRVKSPPPPSREGFKSPTLFKRNPGTSTSMYNMCMYMLY